MRRPGAGERAYDTLFSLIGQNPDDIRPEYKRPTYVVQPDETEAIEQFLTALGQRHNRDLSTGFIYCQPIAADTTRSLPASCIQKVLQGANEVAERRNLSLLVGHNQAFSQDITNLVDNCPSAINIVGMIASRRGLAAIISRAQAVISTGSLAMHLAAALDVPCLGISASHDPQTTAKYYPRMGPCSQDWRQLMRLGIQPI